MRDAPGQRSARPWGHTRIRCPHLWWQPTLSNRHFLTTECPDCLRSFRTELGGSYAAGSVHLPRAKAAYRVRLRDVKEVLWVSHAV
jgi:hypothetical protein